jgi:hypothetical protein
MDYYIYCMLLEHYVQDLEYDQLWNNLQRKIDEILSYKPASDKREMGPEKNSED